MLIVDKNIFVLHLGVATGVYMQQLGYTFMVQFAGCIASLVAVTLVAVVLDLFGNFVLFYSFTMTAMFKN